MFCSPPERTSGIGARFDMTERTPARISSGAWGFVSLGFSTSLVPKGSGNTVDTKNPA